MGHLNAVAGHGPVSLKRSWRGTKPYAEATVRSFHRNLTLKRNFLQLFSQEVEGRTNHATLDARSELLGGLQGLLPNQRGGPASGRFLPQLSPTVVAFSTGTRQR